VKRLALLVPLVLVVVGLSACGGDDPVATVNGEEVMTQDELQGLLEDVSDADDLLTSVNGRGAGSGTLRSGYVSSVVIGNVVLSELLRGELEEQGVEVSDEDVENGTQILTDNLGNPQDGSNPLTVDQLPESYQDDLLDLYARYTALLVAFGGDPTDAAAPETQAALQDLSDRLVELRRDADVEIDPRWGRWVVGEGGGTVEPPEGPAASATTAPAVVPAG